MIFSQSFVPAVFLIIFFESSGSPITPVDARKISFLGTSKLNDSVFIISIIAFFPAGPVNTFAFPEFIRIAETFFFLIMELLKLLES